MTQLSWSFIKSAVAQVCTLYTLLLVALDVRVDLLAVHELQHGVSLRLEHGHPHVGVVLVLHQVRGSAVYVLLSVDLDVCVVLPVPPPLPAKMSGLELVFKQAGGGSTYNLKACLLAGGPTA